MLLESSDCEAGSENCEKLIGVNVKFQRIRRITGYLTGTVDRFNNAKRKEVNDRVFHAGAHTGQLPKTI